MILMKASRSQLPLLGIFSSCQNLATLAKVPIVLVYLAVLGSLSGCGAITGIPGHGGGKRFATEQELVAASTRAAIKGIDLSAIRGRKVNIFVNAIGDTGTGNLFGGRFSIISQLRGDYIQSPKGIERSVYPRYTSTSSSGFGNNTTSTLLASPTETTSRQHGGGGELQFGAEYKGLGAYQNSEEISSDDLQYLAGLLQSYFFLKGVLIVPPSEAEVDIYITVDVFGTVRTRVDWLIANNEILRARTNLEVMAVDHVTGQLLMEPQSAASEAEYNEQYVLWAGPVSIRKYLKKGDALLSDFTNLAEENTHDDTVTILEENVPYPFQ